MTLLAFSSSSLRFRFIFLSLASLMYPIFERADLKNIGSSQPKLTRSISNGSSPSSRGHSSRCCAPSFYFPKFFFLRLFFIFFSLLLDSYPAFQALASVVKRVLNLATIACMSPPVLPAYAVHSTSSSLLKTWDCLTLAQYFEKARPSV